jgi:hypothetical protein|tara:strand:+ start:11142 stop:11615 length:474 start_codon:yes stop_codon:yes gene_type:complete
MIRRIGRRIQRYFSCLSGTRDGSDDDNIVHIRPESENRVELRRNVLFPVYIVRNGRRQRKEKTAITGILKINIDNIENIDVNTNIEEALEVKEMGVYTKDDVNILCSICLEKIDYMNDIRFIQPCCGQVYHLDCIGKWVKENQTCPICKNPLLVFME